MKINSIRTRLTMWNIGVLALTLLVLATAVRYSVQTYMLMMTDRELEHVSHRINPILETAGKEREIASKLKQMDQLRRNLERDSRPERNTHRIVRIFDTSGRQRDPFGGFIHPGESPWSRRLFIASLSGKSVYSTIKVDNEPVRIYSRPIVDGDKTVGVVQVIYPLTELAKFLRGLTFTLIALFPLVLLVAGFGGMFLTSRWLRPVKEITHAADEISAHDLSRRLEIAGDDEFYQLASTFNGMLARLQEAFKKLEGVVEQQRRFAADASHELRTPLTTIKANTSLALRKSRTNEEYREALTAADGAADMMDRLIQDLLLLARSDSGQLVTTKDKVLISDIFRDAVALAARDETQAELEIALSEQSLATTGDDHQLTRLIVNLLVNAFRHTPKDGLVTLSAYQEHDHVLIRVTDTGEGIEPDHLPHIFERFYRIDKARSRSHGGNGLGLAICRSIVEAHNGSISIESSLCKGTIVTVKLPVHR